MLLLIKFRWEGGRDCDGILCCMYILYRSAVMYGLCVWFGSSRDLILLWLFAASRPCDEMQKVIQAPKDRRERILERLERNR